ncbi:hypothetical protein M406DRAFT_74482 [Cryphonectria parasitica EP155]|uniref:Uncharacterized protein n=1 Tax=Cryphonectria parasitica (strain ATCC 38755 / EP155) TaxID=660469 RepID=A0A9P4XVE9_CRYP1|nr:uncharacterized protein M406DRAFT_74482 [Cryphonectria parasitica EP155]KAF3761531.1 hypothetical protein M406DRAFT_74482 [Cryphonectria parasitica EP155]
MSSTRIIKPLGQSEKLKLPDHQQATGDSDLANTFFKMCLTVSDPDIIMDLVDCTVTEGGNRPKQYKLPSIGGGFDAVNNTVRCHLDTSPTALYATFRQHVHASDAAAADVQVKSIDEYGSPAIITEDPADCPLTSKVRATECNAGLFNWIPAELRLQIYGYLFVNPHVTLEVEDFHYRGRDKTSKPRILNTVHHDGVYNLLATCRAIHNDALPSYWQGVTLTCQGKSGVCYLDEFVDAIPPIILNNVKHLRNVNLPHIKSRRLRGHPELTAHALLQRFKKGIKTCEIVISHSDGRGKLGKHTQKTIHGMRETGVFFTRALQEPRKWLNEAYGLPKGCQTHFLSQRVDTSNKYFPVWRAVTFLSYTRGTFVKQLYRGHPPEPIDLEQGFRSAMNLRPI